MAKNKVVTPDLDAQAGEMQRRLFQKMNSILSAEAGDIDSDTLRDELNTINTAGRVVNNYFMMKRINQSQNIRVFALISNDKEQLQRYVSVTMPEMVPSLEFKEQN